jgi:outer membrane protein OmpA-like peptidoglycan-associated protein
MNPKLKECLMAAVVAALLVAAPGLAAAEIIRGNIVSHEGNKLVVLVGDAKTTVTLTDSTKIVAIVGVVGARREDRPASDLINGLLVNIDTVQNGEELDAARVTFNPKDLRAARTVHAGTEEAKEKVRAVQAENERIQAENKRLAEENAERLNKVGQFDTRGSVRVLFASGKTAISAKGKQDLQDIARQAMATPGGLIRVVGNADSTGNAALNQKLSDQRASNVTAYLISSAHVPHEKFVSSSGLGASMVHDMDNSEESKAQARRVTVYILVSKAAQRPTSR